MARQVVAAGTTGPLYVNETGTTSSGLSGGLFIDQTSVVWGYSDLSFQSNVSRPSPVKTFEFSALPFGGSVTAALPWGFAYEAVASNVKPLPQVKTYQFSDLPLSGPVTPVVVTATAPDPWYPDKKTPYYPDRKHYNEYLQEVKRREQIRWELLTRDERRRIELRTAIEYAVRGVSDESESEEVAVAEAPRAIDTSGVFDAIRDFGIKIRRNEEAEMRGKVDAIIRDQDKRRKLWEQEDERDIEILMLHI